MPYWCWFQNWGCTPKPPRPPLPQMTQRSWFYNTKSHNFLDFLCIHIVCTYIGLVTAFVSLFSWTGKLSLNRQPAPLSLGMFNILRGIRCRDLTLPPHRHRSYRILFLLNYWSRYYKGGVMSSSVREMQIINMKLR